MPEDASRSTDQSPPLEIERKFLLRDLPKVPPGAQRLRMEQGYLPAPGRGTSREPGQEKDQQAKDHVELNEGRLRRTTFPDGTVRCHHTIKRGSGLVREEREQPIDEAMFETHWPRTRGRRLSKTRWRVPEGELIWEIDQFDDIDLCLAEIELPHVDAMPAPPDWLAPHIEREVTDDPRFTNHSLALEWIARQRRD